MSARVPKGLDDGCVLSPVARDAEDMRCHCGSLIARLVGGVIELKCRRCKRTVRLAVQPETSVR